MKSFTQEYVNYPQEPEGHLQTATLAMGCFWSPEALFGALPGVVRTRTGYAGGTTDHPAYRAMGDHSETVQVEYDPAQISYEELLTVFWNHHNPLNINGYKGRQYMSLILYPNAGQLHAAQQMIQRKKEAGQEAPQTELLPFKAFYLAEDRHQKYYLHRFPDAVEKLSLLYPNRRELLNSTIAARLNGLAKGYTNLSRIREEIGGWPLDAEKQEELVHVISSIRW